ncbi:MAG TPA: YncE family protein, partial [Thermoanaerobaculia bacterium]|nr:YncE family protein [Thermoanaerobaculia bacterium]
EGLSGVHGIALADDLGRAYISNGRAGTVTVIELPSLKKIAEWKASGEGPDAILYDRPSGRVFTFNGRGRNITAFDAKSGEVVATIAVDAKPEFAVSRGNGIVYVNLEDRNEIAEIDAKAAKVVRRWSIAPCESPSGLAFDAKHARLFSVCDNKTMAVSDADAGKVVATVPIGDGPDGAAFDPAKNLAFSSNGRSGTLTVVEEVSPDKYRVVQTLDTARGARTIVLDERNHHLYMPTAKVGEGRKVEPGTFEVVDVGP